MITCTTAKPLAVDNIYDTNKAVQTGGQIKRSRLINVMTTQDLDTAKKMLDVEDGWVVL